MIRNRVLPGVLVVGVACGVLIGRFAWGGKVHAANKPVDSVTFVVYNAGADGYKLYLLLDKGDIVHWVQPSLGKNKMVPVYAHFGQATPCVEGSDTPTCTIKSNPAGTYKYTCTDNPDPNNGTAAKLCTDPGIDPNSSTDGGQLRIAGAGGVPAQQGPATPSTAAAPSVGGGGSLAPEKADPIFQMDCQSDGKLHVVDNHGKAVDGNYHATSYGGLQWNYADFVPTITPGKDGQGYDACSIQSLAGGAKACDISSVPSGDLGTEFPFTMVDRNAAQDQCQGTVTAYITFKK